MAVLCHITELERRTTILYYRTLIAAEIVKLLIRGDEIPVYQNGDLIFGQGESCRGWIDEISRFEADIIAEKPDAGQDVNKAADVFDARLDEILTNIELVAGIDFARVRTEVRARTPNALIASYGPGVRNSLNHRIVERNRT